MAGKLLIYQGALWLLIAALFTACENDTKQLQAISSQETSKPVDRTTGVDMIFSDSGNVRMHIITPLMLQYTKVKNPYTVMPKGVKATFYNDSLKVTSTLTADSAIRREKEQVIELYKHVVATNDKGDVFRSDELIYNQGTHAVTSNKPVTITSVNGDVISGDKLVTNEKFSPWNLSNTKAKLIVNQNISQQ
jgi:LPS export ABC transporter protein LptC